MRSLWIINRIIGSILIAMASIGLLMTFLKTYFPYFFQFILAGNSCEFAYSEKKSLNLQHISVASADATCASAAFSCFFNDTRMKKTIILIVMLAIGASVAYILSIKSDAHTVGSEAAWLECDSALAVENVFAPTSRLTWNQP